MAASEGNVDAVMLLVEELSAETSPRDRWGGTPLDDAVRSGHDAVSDYLKSKGASRGATGAVNRSGTGAADPSADLCHAAATGDVERLRELVSVGSGTGRPRGCVGNRGILPLDDRTAPHLSSLPPTHTHPR